MVWLSMKTWCTLVKMAADTHDTASSNRAKKSLKGLETASTEKVEECFARVNYVLSKLHKYDAIISQREIHRHVLFGLSTSWQRV